MSRKSNKNKNKNKKRSQQAKSEQPVAHAASPASAPHGLHGLRGLHPGAVFACLFGTYVLSMPRSVTLEDSGDFIMSSYFLGIPHAPGFPIYTLLGHVFTWLPVGSVAFRVHLLSAAAGAGACVALWSIVLRLTRRPLMAHVGAFAYGFSALFWGQSIIAEVYALNSFFCFGLFAACLRFRETGEPRLAAAIAFFYGLALSNHPQLTAVASPCFLLLVWPRRIAVLRTLPLALPALALGLSPYLYLVLRSQFDPAVSFTGPISSWSDFIYFVGRLQFEDASASADLSDRLGFARFLLAEMVRQFGPLGALLSAVGFALQWRRWPVSLVFALLLAWFGSGLALVGLLSFDYEQQFRNVVSAFPAFSYGIMAIWLALALSELSERLPKQSIPASLWRGLELAGCILVVALVVAGSWRANSRSQDSWARDYAQVILDSLAPDAVLFTFGHFHLGPLGYLHLVEGYRPDVTLYNERGLVFPNRLFSPHTTEAAAHEAIHNFIRGSDRPIYFMNFSSVPLPFGFEDFGLFLRVWPDRLPSQRGPVSSPELLDYFEAVLASEPTDAWTRFHREQLIGKASHVLAPLVLAHSRQAAAPTSDAAALLRRQQELLDGLTQSYTGKMVVVSAASNGGVHPEEVLVLLEEAEQFLDASVSKSTRAQLYAFRAKTLLALGRDHEAILNLEQAVETYPHPERNVAIPHLARLYLRSGRNKDYVALRKRFPFLVGGR